MMNVGGASGTAPCVDRCRTPVVPLQRIASASLRASRPDGLVGAGIASESRSGIRRAKDSMTMRGRIRVHQLKCGETGRGQSIRHVLALTITLNVSSVPVSPFNGLGGMDG